MKKNPQTLSADIRTTLQAAADLPQFPDDQPVKEASQREMLKVMDEMEQARERIGNYCVTIGKGDERIILLKKWYENNSESSQSGKHYYRSYQCLTKDGVRTLMIYDIGTDPWHHDEEFIAELDKADREGRAHIYPDGIFYDNHWKRDETFEQFEARRDSIPGDVPKSLLKGRTNADFRFFNWNYGGENDGFISTMKASVELVQRSVVQQHNDTLRTTQNLQAAASGIRAALGGTPPVK